MRMRMKMRMRMEMKMRLKTNRKIIVLAACLCALGIFIAGCGASGFGSEKSEAIGDIEVQGTAPEAAEEEPEMTEKNPVVEITMQGGGKIVIELDAEAAPVTVANFLKLVDEGYYDGLTFHRIIPGFMIQGGCPDGTGMGGPKERIKGEFASNGWDNPISHVRGVISMARSGDPNSAGSQFFITNADSLYLDGDYAAFGVVISGMEVVDEITATELNGEKPVVPPVIESIKRK